VRYPPTDLPVTLPCVMGIVNVTPDSFSDGGLHDDTDSAVAHGLLLAAQGAAILDIGGESTRPGSDPVSVDEELARVVPVIERLAATSPALISIDTTKAAVARAALDAGAGLVNDVTALRRRPGDGGAGRGAWLSGVSHAHARRAPHDAGRPPLRRRGR